VISRSNAAIVTPCSADAGEGMNRNLQRNAGAARNSRLEPERRFCWRLLTDGLVGARYRFEARSLGFTPLSAGSEEKGARRFGGCGVRVGR
jgi:hypothetical protein